MIFCIRKTTDFFAVRGAILSMIVWYFYMNVEYFLYFAHCQYDFHGDQAAVLALSLIFGFLVTVFVSGGALAIARVRATWGS